MQPAATSRARGDPATSPARASASTRSSPCTGCKASVPRAVARREAMASSGIELVLVGVLAQDDSIADARAVLASWGVDSPFIVDRKGTILRKYGISDMPAAVVLDRSGAIQWVSPEEDAGIGAAEAAAERARRAPCGG
ncbi:MAG: redoxin domain-containing protein [Polyangiaceae bacterium]|nr:redoxin domain-containing protein [Polyangiaceae bacterium]